MVIVRRWSCRIVGLYSGRMIPLNFCRFFTRRAAERFAARLDRNVPPSLDRVTRVEAYRRRWGARR